MFGLWVQAKLCKATYLLRLQEATLAPWGGSGAVGQQWRRIVARARRRERPQAPAGQGGDERDWAERLPHGAAGSLLSCSRRQRGGARGSQC